MRRKYYRKCGVCDERTVPTKFCDDNANWVMHECVPEEIDKLVKEMTEEEKQCK